jgi:uncharacterized protein YegP (UPF0339 family)
MAGQLRWRLKPADGGVVADSKDCWWSKEGADLNAQMVQSAASGVEIAFTD